MGVTQQTDCEQSGLSNCIKLQFYQQSVRKWLRQWWMLSDFCETVVQIIHQE